jgi:hypothetical protein
MPDLTADALVVLLRLVGGPPDVYEILAPWKEPPGRSGRDALVRYVRWIDQRRLFGAPLAKETDEPWLGRFIEARLITDECLAELAHAGARAVLEAVGLSFQQFLARWSGHEGRDVACPTLTVSADSEEHFKDLGDLRCRVRLSIGVLAEFEPTAVAPTLSRDSEADGDTDGATAAYINYRPSGHDRQPKIREPDLSRSRRWHVAHCRFDAGRPAA